MKTYSFLSWSGLYINFKFREKAVKTTESPLNCLWELSALNNCLNWDNLQHKMTQSLEISYACKNGIKCATPPQTFNLMAQNYTEGCKCYRQRIFCLTLGSQLDAFCVVTWQISGSTSFKGHSLFLSDLLLVNWHHKSFFSSWLSVLTTG